MTRVCCIAASLLAATATPARAAARGSYLYSLADSTGKLDLGWASLSWDASHHEIYAVSGGAVHVFNESGMEIYSFDDFTGYGSPVGVAVREDGEIMVLAHNPGWSIVRCNYRGEPQSALAVTGAPQWFQDFGADAIFYRRGHIYLSDKVGLRVVMLSADGAYLASWDLAGLIGSRPNGKSTDDIRGLDVDAAGNILFTVPTLFQAFVLSPEGKLSGFGRKGSLPGRFNIAAAITSDDDGNIYVTDVLRAVVMVFDSQFNFLGEFGSRGTGPSNLIAPSTVVVGNGRVIVSQSIGAVKVFGVQIE